MMNDQLPSNVDLQKELQKLRQDYDTIKTAYEKSAFKDKQAEEKLLFINKAFESSGDAIGISNAQGHHIYQNQALSDMFGYSTAEELQAAGGGTVVVYDPAVAKEMYGNIRSGKSWTGELQMVTKSGRVFSAFERADAIKDHDGNIIGLIGIITDITDRKNTEVRLRISEEQFKKAQAVGHVGSWEYNIKSGTFWGSDEGKRIYGFDLLSDTFTAEDLMKCAIESDRVKQARIDLIEKNTPYNIVYDIIPRNSNEKRTINSIAELIRDEQGDPLKVTGVLIDITERKQEEKRINLSSKILTLLNTTIPFNETIELIISYIKEFYGFDAIGIRIKNGDDYPYYSHMGFNNSFLNTENTLIERTKQGDICTDKNGKPSLECTCGLVITGNIDSANPLFTEGGSFYTNDSPVLLGLTPDQEPRHNPRNRCIHDGYQSVALIPIRNSGNIVGLLQFNDRKKDRFTPMMIQFFESIGETVGLALIRKQSLEDLKSREMEFRLLAESMPQIVWITDPDGLNIYFNHQWVEYTGLSLEESYGHGWNKPFHPDDQQRAWIAWQNATQHGAAYSLECRLCRADGEYKWWLVRGVPVYDTNGTVIKWFGTCTDIDDLKQKERELFHTKAIVQGAMDQSQAGIIIADAPYGKIRYVNNAGLLIRGGSGQELINDVGIDQYVAAWQLFDLEGSPLTLDEVPLTRAIKYGETSSKELIIRRKIEDDRIVLAKAAPIKDESGNVVAAIVVFLDISESKQSEIALKKSLAEVQQFNSLLVGRELRMIELKQEINDLLKKFGGEEKYTEHLRSK